MQETLSNRPLVAGNTNTSLLKIIALVFMCLDHVGKVFFPAIPEFRIVGRIAFPLYCYCAAVGVCYTKSCPKYLLRIFVTGLVSQPLYMWSLGHRWHELNIFATIFLGVSALYAIKSKWNYSHIWGPIVALCLADLIVCDYGWKGVLLIILLYFVIHSKPALISLMVAFCLFWGSTSSTIRSVLGVPLNFTSWPIVGSMLSSFIRLQGMAILALPFMLIPMKSKVRLPQWLGYSFYPLHLAVIIAVRELMF